MYVMSVVVTASGWESEGRWLDPRYLRASFVPRLPKKNIKNIPNHSVALMKKYLQRIL